MLNQSWDQALEITLSLNETFILDAKIGLDADTNATENFDDDTDQANATPNFVQCLQPHMCQASLMAQGWEQTSLQRDIPPVQEHGVGQLQQSRCIQIWRTCCLGGWTVRRRRFCRYRQGQTHESDIGFISTRGKIIICNKYN